MARQRLDHLPLTTRRRPCGQRVAARRSGASVAICACGAVWRRLIWMEFCQLRCTASCCGCRRRADQHRQITGASPLPLPPPPPPRGPARGFALTYSSSSERTSCHLPPGDLRTGQCTPHHWRTLDSEWQLSSACYCMWPTKHACLSDIGCHSAPSAPHDGHDRHADVALSLVVRGVINVQRPRHM